MPIVNVYKEKELKNAYIGEYIPAGIYHNATLGLISLSSDGSNWLTIADKNLGATTVFEVGSGSGTNGGATISETNCGKFFQWGNNYGFPFTGATSTSSTLVNAAGYGPGNYYNSSTFIIGSGQLWTTDASNTNMWGADTGTNVAMRGPCGEGFHVPTQGEMSSFVTLLNGFSPTGYDIYRYTKIPSTSNLNRTDGGLNTAANYNMRHCYMWCSTFNAYGDLYYNGSDVTISLNTTAATNNMGYSIRPFKNEAVQPDSSRTKLD